MTLEKTNSAQKTTLNPDKANVAHPRATELLTDFGLSENEARTYIYLLERGEAVGGTKIAYGTGLFRQYVYSALPALHGKGLVEVVEHGKHKRYRAVAPSEIGRIARKRLLEADDIVTELEKFSTIGAEQDVEVVQGERAIQEYELHRIKTVPEGTVQHFIGGASKHFFRIMGDVYTYDYAPIALERGVGTKYLGTVGERGAMHSAGDTQGKVEFRVLEKLPEGVVNVMIMNDTLSFYTFVNPPVLYVIKSQIVAESYLNFFNMLWDMGNEITKSQ